MRTLEELRKDNKLKSYLYKEYLMGSENPTDADYLNYVPSKEELALKEEWLAVGRQTIIDYEKEIWG